MSSFGATRGCWLLVMCALAALVLLPGKAAAFGAGNIPSVAQVEGHNWRHGDIEDMLETVAFLYGKKWSSMLIKRTYFGNWLRDYSQAVDVGSLKGVNAGTIRILVWILSFMAFGYATDEFEVTEERLGVYRPEEHIDNPLGYADGTDARKFDPRLRGPVEPIETEIDMNTGMKNYIANETGRWATSAGYLRFSFARAIHFGRLFTSGDRKGKDEDLCEALRCLGQALHCIEDFTAHSNYCELALRELGYRDVFPHCGNQTEINVRGKRIFPLVTGTFGAVDFLHSVIGEATDHFTQSEVDQVDCAMKNAEGNGGSSKPSGLLGLISPPDFISMIGKIPGCGGDFATQARSLQASSDAQERENQARSTRTRADTSTGSAAPLDLDIDPVKTAGQIYPILKFRDNIVRTISRGVSKIPGLEKLLERIGETLTVFILGLLAPFVRPIINQVSKALKNGSSNLIQCSAEAQLEPWTNPRCSNPTHSMLSKDHFTNILNPCAGRVAASMLQYTVPRVLYAFEHTEVPVDEVVNDILRAFHHPALRNDNIEVQRDMFKTVKQWVDEHPRRHELERMLSSQSVKDGRNHILNQADHKADRSGPGGHSHNPRDMLEELGHGKVAGSLWSQVRTRDTDSLHGRDGDPANHYLSTTPAPPGGFQNQAQGHGYGAGSSPAHNPSPYGGAQGGYSAHPPQGGLAGSYYQDHQQQPTYQDQHQRPAHQQGQHQQPPYHQVQHQQPAYGDYGAPPPPQGYGGPGYGAPQYPPYGQQPQHGQQPPPPSSWNQYPGQGRRY
ncbi:hypothetical protein S40293_07566 [Stachybotrys chartarum IBT 40293]|nr:hypothetical protein S40293_07566 [Stachybotrys chartarum IBT 40293]